MRILRATYIVACAAGLACHDVPLHPQGCSGTIDIQVVQSVSPGRPAFAWSPRCGVTELTVSTVPPLGGAGILVWDIVAPERAPIGPAVTYGVTPQDATVRRAAAELVTGVTYRVGVATIVGGDAIAGSGSATFRR